MHNDKPTYYHNDSVSKLDHIYSKSIGKINNIRTIITGYSDHCIILFNYNTKFDNTKPKFAFKRDKYLLTTHTLKSYIENNQNLNSIFNYEDPEIITNILTSELNLIINCIAPKKRIQLTKKFAPYINKQLKAEITIKNSQYKKYIKTKDKNDLLEFRNKRREVNHKIKQAKNAYYSKIFSNNNSKDKSDDDNIFKSNVMWKTLKDTTNTNKGGTPSNIIYEGRAINKPVDIAHIANKFYINKVKNLRTKFKNTSYDPIDILHRLFKKNENKFDIPMMTIKDTKDLIKNAKYSWTVCNDEISMMVLKKINPIISIHLNHLFNTITRTKIYPSHLKVSKIIPILKPGKNKFEIGSYRPINISHPIDKLYQEFVKNHLLSFLNVNNIIVKNHQGGLKKHGTDTALSLILNYLYINKENNKISCVLQTDLSAAYDTIDHQVLIKKLQFYGVDGDSLSIIKNYLSNRFQFVQIDTFNSSILNCLDCSVIQGSKLSSLLYILYTNEIPNLHKLIVDQNLLYCYYKLTKNKYKLLHDKIKDKCFNHLTINFIDDSTNLISYEKSDMLINYLTISYDLIKEIYDINILTINLNKTELLVSCKNVLRT